MRSGRIQDIDELLTDYICFEGMIDKDDRQIGGLYGQSWFSDKDEDGIMNFRQAVSQAVQKT